MSNSVTEELKPHAFKWSPFISNFGGGILCGICGKPHSPYHDDVVEVLKMTPLDEAVEMLKFCAASMCSGCAVGHVESEQCEVPSVSQLITKLGTRAVAPTDPSDAAVQAAREVAANYEVHKNRCHSNERYPSPPCDCGAIEDIVDMITRHLAPKE